MPPTNCKLPNPSLPPPSPTEIRTSQLAEQSQREFDAARTKLDQIGSAACARQLIALRCSTEQLASLRIRSCKLLRLAQEQLRTRSAELEREQRTICGPKLDQCERRRSGREEPRPNRIRQRSPRPSSGLLRSAASWRAPTGNIARSRRISRASANASPCCPSWSIGWKASMAACKSCCAWPENTAGESFGEVLGVVADLFHVDVDTAPLLEVALGERAQFIVLASADRLLERLARQPLGVAGTRWLPAARHAAAAQRRSITSTSQPNRALWAAPTNSSNRPPEFRPLAKRLLGRTWLVDRMSTALRLSQTAGRGLEFVTSDGELLAADGTIVIGSAPGRGWHHVAPQRTAGLPRTSRRIGKANRALRHASTPNSTRNAPSKSRSLPPRPRPAASWRTSWPIAVEKQPSAAAEWNALSTSRTKPDMSRGKPKRESHRFWPSANPSSRAKPKRSKHKASFKPI